MAAACVVPTRLMADDLQPPNDYAEFVGVTSWFRLRTVGYQFPENTSGDDDSNWLVISGTVSQNGREWSFLDPCLETTELDRLANWISHVAKEDSTQNDCAFIEPNLQFKLIDKRFIRITLSYESSPPWLEGNERFDGTSIEVPVSPDLIETADAIKKQLTKFPPR